MTKLHILFSTALSIAAFSLPAMAQGQSHEQQHARVVCNDGTVVNNNSKDACAMHSGVRASNNNRHVVRQDVKRDVNRDVNRDMKRDVKRDVNHDMNRNTDRGDQRGMTTAQMMAELHIDHTKNNATARCQDGFYYHGQHDRSACSHDGGVSVWYK